MFAKLFIAFAILPIIEIALLLNVGEFIGGWNTVAIVILTAFFGAHLVRQQGFATLAQAQTKLQTGQMPGQEMAEGLLLVVAGVLLVTPGFITDGIGFLFSLPFSRPAIARFLLRHMSVRVVNTASQGSFQQGQWQQRPDNHHTHNDIIEGEFERQSDSVPCDNRIDKP